MNPKETIPAVKPIRKLRRNFRKRYCVRIPHLRIEIRYYCQYDTIFIRKNQEKTHQAYVCSRIDAELKQGLFIYRAQRYNPFFEFQLRQCFYTITEERRESANSFYWVRLMLHLLLHLWCEWWCIFSKTRSKRLDSTHLAV